jgi:phospholipase C
VTRGRTAALAAPVLCAALAACGGGGGGGDAPPVRQAPSPTPSPAIPQYVVVIVQENRSVDNLFQGFPGADTQSYGLGDGGAHIPLVPVALDAPFDVDHDHSAFVAEFHGGKVDGFQHVRVACTRPKQCGTQTPYSYVYPADVRPYWKMAEQYGFADEMLQSNEGSSFAAHQYLIAGQSGHPWAMSGIPNVRTGGCGVPGAQVDQIDMTSPYPGVLGNPEPPCKDYATVLDLLVNKGFSWRYYTPFPTYVYNAPYAIHHIYYGPTAGDDVNPETNILTDIQAHRLANVSYLVSRLQLTDHPGFTSGNGPYWVAWIANALFTDSYYAGRTVLLVTWDDWGGMEDHVAPHHPQGLPEDPYEYGFRVPLIVVSPYVRSRHLVDHTPRDQTAIIHFIESTYGLRSLGQLDAKTDDLGGMFDFSRTPLPYTKIDTGSFTPKDVLRYPLRQGED